MAKQVYPAARRVSSRPTQAQVRKARKGLRGPKGPGRRWVSQNLPGRRLTKGQRLYRDVTALENKVRELMDDIPYVTLGSRTKTCQALESADSHLRDVVAQLQIVWNEEVPRYNRSAESQS